MFVVRSQNGVSVRLTDERWQHIIHRHPEMNSQREQVLATISKPDMIQLGDTGEFLAIRYLRHTPVGSKFMIVAYRESNSEDGYVLTAYFTNQPAAWRRMLWKR
jgi:hypothetical protein